jgi:hypothetical protein
MEIYSSSVEDKLIDGLSFKLSEGSSYITSRQSQSFWTSGSSTYSPTTGNKVIRIPITS